MTVRLNTISHYSFTNKVPAFNSNNKKSNNPAIQNNSFLGLNALAMQNKALMFAGKTPEIDPATQTMRNVLENVKIANVSTFHTAAIDVIDVAQERGLINKEKPLTLLHFDEHADLRTKGNHKTDFGNWINKTLKDGTVNEVYWVLPEWTLYSEYKERYWDNKTDQASIYFCDNKKDFKLYVDKESQTLHFEKPADYETNKENYKTVTVHKITIEELPDFSDKDNLMLDVCGDYLLSNVEDAFICRESSSYIRYEIEERFNKIFNELEKRGAKPILYTGAESIDYVPRGYYMDIAKQLQKAVKNAANGNTTNELITYKNDDNIAAKDKTGKNISTVDVFLGPLFFNLKHIENESRLNLFKPENEEGKKLAVDEIAEYFETDTKTAEEIYEFIGQKLCPSFGSVYEIEESIKDESIIDYKEAFLKQFEGKLEPWQIGL